MKCIDKSGNVSVLFTDGKRVFRKNPYPSVGSYYGHPWEDDYQDRQMFTCYECDTKMIDPAGETVDGEYLCPSCFAGYLEGNSCEKCGMEPESTDDIISVDDTSFCQTCFTDIEPNPRYPCGGCETGSAPIPGGVCRRCQRELVAPDGTHPQNRPCPKCGYALVDQKGKFYNKCFQCDGMLNPRKKCDACSNMIYDRGTDSEKDNLCYQCQKEFGFLDKHFAEKKKSAERWQSMGPHPRRRGYHRNPYMTETAKCPSCKKKTQFIFDKKTKKTTCPKCGAKFNGRKKKCTK